MGAVSRLNQFEDVLSTSLARTFAKQRRGDLVWKAERAYALEILRKNNYLQTCDPSSLGMAMLDLAWSGLSLNPTLGLAYLIPYEGMLTLKPSYRGLEQLVYRAGTMRTIQSVLVHEGDFFRVETVNNRRVITHSEKHKPGAEVTAAYCILHYANSDVPYIEVMYRDQLDDVEQIARDQGANGKGGKVWRTVFKGEMQRKTVLRRALKHAPLDDGGHIAHAQAVANKFEPVDFDKAPPARTEPVEQLISKDQVVATHRMLTDAGMQSGTADRWMQLLAEAMGYEDFAKVPESRYQEARNRLNERVEQAKKKAAANE